MSIYRARFTGREVGAIGVFQEFTVDIVGAKNEEEATKRLYDTYEHISQLKFEKIA